MTESGRGKPKIFGRALCASSSIPLYEFLISPLRNIVTGNRSSTIECWYCCNHGEGWERLVYVIAWFAVVFGINSTSNVEIIVRGAQ